MRRAAGPEPVARCAERSVPMRLQHLQGRLLDEAVENRRHAEGANASPGLRDLDPPDRPRLVGAVKQSGPDRRPMLFQMRRQRFDAHAVDPRRALVALNLRQRLPQIVPLDNRLHARSGKRRRAFELRRPPHRFRSLRRAGSRLHPSPSRRKPVRAGFSTAWPMRGSPPYSPFQPFGPSADTQA